LSKGKVVVKSIFVSHLRMESHDEFKSGGKCCGDESPSTSSEDTVNEERLAGDKQLIVVISSFLTLLLLLGWSRTQIDTNKFVEQQKLA
jgi:hypothetical protein